MFEHFIDKRRVDKTKIKKKRFNNTKFKPNMTVQGYRGSLPNATFGSGKKSH